MSDGIKGIIKFLVVVVVTIVATVIVHGKVLDRKVTNKPKCTMELIRESVDNGYLVDHDTNEKWSVIPIANDTNCVACHFNASFSGRVDVSALKCPYMEAQKKKDVVVTEEVEK